MQPLTELLLLSQRKEAIKNQLRRMEAKRVRLQKELFEIEERRISIQMKIDEEERVFHFVK